MVISAKLLVLERKRFIRNLKPLFRKVDAAIEKMEREIIRILKRRVKPPEEDDLVRLLQFSLTIAENLNRAVIELKKGYIQ